MNVAQAKQTVRAWIEANTARWPGLRAAHLVGGVNSLPDEAPFPANKDIDLHLVFAEDSPILRAEGPFMNILEESLARLAVEAGIKSVADYRSPGLVLCNPEIAYHLTVDSVLYDPSFLLRDLQSEVRRGYARRRWVHARIDHERHGLDRAFAMRPMAAAHLGPSGEVSILGYAMTFLTTVLQVAQLRAPRIGSGMLVRMREALSDCGRLDLYDDVLALFGLQDVTPTQVEDLLNDGIDAFDLAVAVIKTPHPAQHKMHRHLRPYFVESCGGMVAAGDHREALFWGILFCLTSTDVILADGPAAVQPAFAAYQHRFLQALGMDDAGARADRYVQAERLADRFFALAEEIIDRHPEIED
ncbi:MAG TPA: hypothetical protein VH482_01835 [Thermomicrobiales bacterium]|jgi:hypothetical protein